MWNPGTWWLGLPAHAAFPWSFGRRSKPVPPNVTPVLLHLSRFGNTLYSPRESCSSTTLRFTTTCADSTAPNSFRLTMFWVEKFLFLCVCCLSLRTKGWLGLCRQTSIHLQLFNYSQANLTFKSPTHMHWTAVLSPVQILKRGRVRERESRREREREAGKEWNGKISQPLVTGWGAEKNSTQLSKPSQIQDFTCTLFSPLFSLLIHSLFL